MVIPRNRLGGKVYISQIQKTAIGAKSKKLELPLTKSFLAKASQLRTPLLPHFLEKLLTIWSEEIIKWFAFKDKLDSLFKRYLKLKLKASLNTVVKLYVDDFPILTLETALLLGYDF